MTSSNYSGRNGGGEKDILDGGAHVPPLRWRFSLSLAPLFPYHFPYHFLMFSARRFPAAAQNHWQCCEVKRVFDDSFLLCAHGLRVHVQAHEITLFHICLYVKQNERSQSRALASPRSLVSWYFRPTRSYKPFYSVRQSL